jgi:multiple sugar transport system permease protein
LPFILPYLPFLIAFGVAPMLYALDLAFTNASGGWTGLHNFVRTFEDYRFVPAFEHILLYTGVWLGSLMVFVVGLALLLHGRASRTSSTFRFLFYAGRAGGAASVPVWLFMLDPASQPGSFLLHRVPAQLFVDRRARHQFVFAMIVPTTPAGSCHVRRAEHPGRTRGRRAHDGRARSPSHWLKPR